MTKGALLDAHQFQFDRIALLYKIFFILKTIPKALLAQLVLIKHLLTFYLKQITQRLVFSSEQLIKLL